MKSANQAQRTAELSEEKEALAQTIFTRIKSKMDDELLDMVRAIVAKEPGEIFGAGEFELRDRLNQVGATILEESVNAQAKKGVHRC